MSAGRFAHPEWIVPLALGVTVLAVVLARAVRRARRRLDALLGARAPRLAWLPDAALLVALLFVAVALAGPRIGERLERVTASGVDLVVLVDVSQSMATRDVAPSRLARAQRAAEQVLSRLAAGDRAALAAFAGRGVLLTPLTPDADALVDLLPALDPELMHAQGSRLADGVRAALGAYEAESDRPRVLLVLSDGEDPAGGAEDAAAVAEAARAGVRVLAAAFGLPTGGIIPDRGAPLRDGDGRVVISRPDPRRLAALAVSAGGELLATDAFGALDAEAAVRAIRRDAPRTAGAVHERKVPAVQVAPFAALAFLVLGLELARPGRPRRPGERSPTRVRVAGAPRLARTAPIALALALLGAPRVASPDAETPPPAPPLDEAEARVRAEPASPERLLELGLARAAGGDHEGAAHAFGAAAAYARDPAVAGLGYYDLGVANLAQGRLAEARDAFFDALAFSPSDRRAQFNLEWTLRALAAQPPPGASEDEDKKGEGEEKSGESKPDAGSEPSSAPPPSAAPSPPRGAEDTRPRAEGAQREPTPSGDGAEGERKPSGDARSSEQPAPSAAASAQTTPSSATPPELSPEEARRWLAGVEDDPARAARQLARRATAGPRPPPGTPTW